MREIVHIQAGQCGNQIGAKVEDFSDWINFLKKRVKFCENCQHSHNNSFIKKLLKVAHTFYQNSSLKFPNDPIY
jgi:hypothetical protein